jgi:4-amino-4-deoxy-L-arabinose transferase-like glycosyltransferase
VVSLVRARPDFLSNPGFSQDESEYSGLAHGILTSGEFRQPVPRQGLRLLPKAGEPTAFRTPGTPLILTAIYAVFGENPGVARLVLSIGNALVSPLIFLLCLLLGLKLATAVGLGTVWAVAPTSLYLAGALYGEEPSCVILLVIICLVVLAERRQSAALAVCAGLILGFGILTRGFLLFIPFTLSAWLWWRGKKGLLVFLLAGAAALPAAWITRNVATMGLWALSSESWEAVWLGNNRWARGSWPANWHEQHPELLTKYPDFDERDELGQAKVFEQEAKADFREDPWRVMALIPRKTAIFFWPRSWIGTDWAFGLLLPFFAMGTVTLWRDRRSRHLLALIGLPVASVFGVSILAFSDVRYRHPIDSMVFIIAGFGLQWVGAQVLRARRARSARRQQGMGVDPRFA